MKIFILLQLLLILHIKPIYTNSEDYYNLLGVSRDATVKEIRKAFKILAVKLHPDKNKDQKDADAKFIEITRAYEILKDPNTRKQYDLHGANDFKDYKKPYHSYTYYRDQFGIYDDDPLIVTLSINDYEINILDDNQAWFVNFYSPLCHHCHTLAPAWRKLASELEGVVRIAAVNCEDDYALCQHLSIESYPTLLYYEKESHLHEGQKYFGARTLDAMKEYVLSKVDDKVIRDIDVNYWSSLKNRSVLLFLCTGNNVNHLEEDTVKKLSVILDGLIPVGAIKDEQLCEEISKDYVSNPIVFWEVDNAKPKLTSIKGSDSKEILDEILNILPNPKELTDVDFRELRNKLRQNSENPWLICFYIGTETDLNLQLKRLPTLIPHVNIGLIHCGKSASLCAALHIVRYPTWGVIKVGDAFEIHHGRDVLHEIAAFARDSTKSTNLHALSPADFNNIKQDGSPWYIDWYAPWCPPCKKLTPELRKASQIFEPKQVQFGTIDCTLHRDLCAREGINSYPTMLLYNQSKIHRFHGTPNEMGIVEFIQDMINPVVFNLDEESFIRLMRKPEDEMWAVDFYAPWCGPCQRLAPEWRRLAKSVSEFKEIKIAQVDCVANSDLCESQKITGYPTIRLYPLKSKGLNTVAIHNGNRDAVSLKRWLLGFLPSNVESLNENEFRKEILTKNLRLPWLVDFYAPWCGHCVHFEPDYRAIAQKLEGKVKSAKVDCEANRIFCGNLGVTGYPTVRLYLSPTEYYRVNREDVSRMIINIKKLVENFDNNNKHDEL